MTVQEIFNTSAITEIETEIINLETDIELSHWNKLGAEETMRTLLRIRRNLLAEMFVMDLHYKKLLEEFNEALKQQLLQMRRETIKIAQNIISSGIMDDDIQVVGKCFLGYRYSKHHPVQTMRAKKIWAILNGTIDNYVRLYDDGVIWGGYVYDSRMKQESENQMLYLSDEPDNWNDELDKEMTKDMHLIYPFHHLYSHTSFSIFDLLWVRDFNMEINLEIDYDTNPKNGESEEITFI